MFLHFLQWLKATVPEGIKCGCFCLGPAPFSCCFAFFFVAKRKSGWGICGSSCLGCLFVVCLSIDMPSFLILANCAEYRLFSPLMYLSGPCHRAFTAKPEEKKKP